MASELIPALKQLKLYGMAAACEELLGERPRQAKDPVMWLEKLIEAERVDRQVRSLNYQLRIARFPIRRELDSFECAESGVDRATFETLAEGPFTSQAHNLILVGYRHGEDPPGHGAGHCGDPSWSAGSLLQCRGSGESPGTGKDQWPVRQNHSPAVTGGSGGPR